MRVPVVLAVFVVCLALSGCEGSTDSQDPSAETPEVTKSAADSAAAPPEPAPGTCWTVPAASVVDQNYWFDDSPQVPCTEPHTTETAVVLRLSEPTIAQAEERIDGCWDFVRRHVGIDAESWVPWGPVAFLPSEEEIAAGATWVRCDVAFPETWDFGSVRTITGSAKGLADAPRADFWACLDEPPSKSDQPLVPCARPHVYEQTGTLALLDGLTEYPAAEELEAEGQQQCREGVPAGYGDVSVTAVWDSPDSLARDSELAASCFMFSADGQPLPGR